MAEYWMAHEAFNSMRDMSEFIEILSELKNS